MGEKTIETMVIETASPYADLKMIAYNNDDDVNNYDFDLISFNTTYVNANNTQILQGYTDLEIFDDDKVFLNEKISLTQSYKIRIYQAKPKKLNLQINLGANKNLTKVIANVKKNLEAFYYPGLEEDIINEINKKMLKAKILIGLRSKSMFDQVKTLVNKIKVNGFLENDFQFVVAVGIEANENSEGTLLHLYKEKKLENQDENQKIDYSNRGFVCAIKEGEIILKYIKPKKGNDGKNLRGEFIKIAPSSNSSVGKPKVSEDEIIEIEDDDCIVYKAAKSGYIIEGNDNSFGIKDNLDLLKVDFKSTGSINAGSDNNIKLNINNADASEDAIGANINIEIDEINVVGSVAQNATIRAIKAEIGGQTHSKSSVYAKNCRIAVHKGYCEGENIEIDKLEGGEVRGDNVRINQAIGGKVYANRLSVGTLNSNSVFYIIKDAFIKSCKGENNKFIISPSNSKELKEEIEYAIKEIQKLNKDLSALPSQIKSRRAVIELNKESIFKVKEKIQELQSQKVEPPKAFFDKLKDFQETLNEYNELVKQEKIIIRKLDTLTNELKKIQERIFQTKVVCKSRWRNLNEIKFIIDYPKQELIHSTIEGELANIITLIRKNELEENLELDICIKNTDDVQDNLPQDIVGEIHEAKQFNIENKQNSEDKTALANNKETINGSKQSQIDISKEKKQ